MSDAGNILTAISTDVSGAVSGVTIGTDPINFEQLSASEFPYCIVVLADYSVEHLDYGQEQRTWSVFGVIAQKAGTREQMQTKLEAIRDAVYTDPTLNSSVDRASCATLTPYSNVDAELIFGEFAVSAEKVV